MRYETKMRKRQFAFQKTKATFVAMVFGFICEIILLLLVLAICFDENTWLPLIIYLAINLFFIVMFMWPAFNIEVYDEYCSVRGKKYYYNQLISITKHKQSIWAGTRFSPGILGHIALDMVSDSEDDYTRYDVRIKFKNGTIHFYHMCGGKQYNKKEARFIQEIEIYLQQNNKYILLDRKDNYYE